MTLKPAYSWVVLGLMSTLSFAADSKGTQKTHEKIYGDSASAHLVPNSVEKPYGFWTLLQGACSTKSGEKSETPGTKILSLREGDSSLLYVYSNNGADCVLSADVRFDAISAQELILSFTGYQLEKGSAAQCLASPALQDDIGLKYRYQINEKGELKLEFTTADQTECFETYSPKPKQVAPLSKR